MSRAGQFDQRVQFLGRNVTSQNASGEDVYGTPTDIGTFWAKVEYLSGKELDAAQQLWAEARYMITIRRQPGVTIRREDSAVWNGQTLDILDVQGPGTREDEWTMPAKDHVA